MKMRMEDLGYKGLQQVEYHSSATKAPSRGQNSKYDSKQSIA